MKPKWRSVWITGASQGIGMALTEALAREGVCVAGSARGIDPLERLQASHPRVMPIALDVTDPVATADVVARIEAQQGVLDLVILNAGVYDPVPGGLAAPELYHRHMEVNYMGVVNALMAVLPRMKERGTGQVAVVASVAGYRGLPQAAAYGPTKAALINLTETLRLELADEGVDMRLVNPGFVATRLTAKNDFFMPAILSPEDAARRILRGLAGSRFEIAFPLGLVIWLEILRIIPYWLFFRLTKGLIPKRNGTAERHLR